MNPLLHEFKENRKYKIRTQRLIFVGQEYRFLFPKFITQTYNYLNMYYKLSHTCLLFCKRSYPLHIFIKITKIKDILNKKHITYLIVLYLYFTFFNNQKCMFIYFEKLYSYDVLVNPKYKQCGWDIFTSFINHLFRRLHYDEEKFDFILHLYLKV